ncbi:MAG: SRPBCC domain-containing protein [Rhodospirillales bacterium]|nr:SRPBCC domain-containing protein [Rhodospirillales bacterium]
MDEFQPGIKPQPLKMSRLLNAPRNAVFRAWSDAAFVKRWFAPEGITIPEAVVELRPGGRFDICMRLPDGAEHWMRCRFTEVTEPEKIVFAGTVDGPNGKWFNAVTTITLAEEAGGTRLNVVQEYEVFAAEALGALKGAEAGWTSTLAQLGREAERLATPAVHGSFTLERQLSAPPAAVFHAFTDLEAKSRWFAGGTGQQILARRMEAKPGGREHVHGRWADGTESIFDAVYFEVLPNRRLVYAYEMHLNGVRISVSLATLELMPDGAGTRLTVTEQGSFLDGYEDKGAREHGTGFLLDRLVHALGGPPPATALARN